MNLSSDLILDYFQKKRRHYSIVRNEAQARRDSDLIIEKEARFVSANPGCSKERIRELNLEKKNIDYASAKEQLDVNFDERGVQEFTACLVMSSVFMITYDGSIVPAAMKSDFTHLKRIGDPSDYGIVLRGRLKFEPNFFVLKMTRTYDELLNAMTVHELVVGHYLNQLRAKGISNFVSVYGSFRCSIPVIDEETQMVKEWCSEYASKKVDYVVYEDIKDSMNALSYLMKEQSVYHVASLFLQIAMATRMANDLFPYTHYDLHPGNVLMRDITSAFANAPIPPESDFYLRYRTRLGEEFYVLADRVATIIDYGTVFANGYGTPELHPVTNGRYADRSFPLHDVYKLLCFVAHNMLFVNSVQPDVKAYIRHLLSFFIDTRNMDKVQQYLDAQFVIRFSLPYEMGSGTSISAFINHILKTKIAAAIVTKDPKNHPVFTPDENASYGDVFYQVVEEPHSSFHELYTNYQLTESTKVPEGFNMIEARDELKEEALELKRETERLFLEMNVVEITQGNYRNAAVLTGFKNFFYKTVELFTLYDRLDKLLTVTNWASSVIREDTQDAYNALMVLKRPMEQRLNLCLKSLAKSASTVEAIVNRNTYANDVNADYSLIWYSENLSVLLETANRSLPQPDLEMHEPKQKRSALIATTTGSLVRQQNFNRA